MPALVLAVIDNLLCFLLMFFFTFLVSFQQRNFMTVAKLRISIEI